MRRGVLAACLWLAFAFVTWNVMFDRLVWTAAVEFTRDQIARHHSGAPLTTIHDGFSPRVGEAAFEASLWTLPLIAVGAAVVFIAFRRVR